MECFLKSIFHDSQYGCEFVLNKSDGLFYHRFKGTKCSIGEDGFPLKDYIQLSNRINICFSINSLVAKVDSGPFSPNSLENQNSNIITIKSYINLENVSDFLLRFFVNYFEVLSKELHFNDNKNSVDDTTNVSQKKRKQIFLSVKNYFDVYMDGGGTSSTKMFQMFRPTHFTKDYMRVLHDWRMAIIYCLDCVHDGDYDDNSVQQNARDTRKIYDKKYIFGDFKTTLDKVKKKKKNTPYCGLKNFLRRPAPYIRCSYYGLRNVKENKTYCTHVEKYYGDLISENVDDVKDDDTAKTSNTTAATYKVDDEKHGEKNGENANEIYERTKKLLYKDDYDSPSFEPCTKVLYFLMDSLGEKTTTELLNFKCMLNKHVANNVDKIYGRCELLHSTFCCPEVLLRDSYEYTLKDFLSKSIV